MTRTDASFTIIEGTQTRKVSGEVKKLGNGAHVMLPREWIGQTVTVTVEKSNG